VMKAPPREALATTAMAAATAPTRVSRTIIGAGNNTRVVTVGRDSSIVYDAREHRFVNGAAVAPSTSAAEAQVQKTDGAKSAVSSERARQVTVVEGRTSASAASNVRVPANTMRTAAPPSRAMAPPPARAASGGAGGGWSGASSRGSAAGSAARSAPSASAGASHPSGGGRPH
jgi:hypothetical protein